MLTTAEAGSTSGKVVPTGASLGAQVYAIGSLGFDFGSLRRRDVAFAASGGRPIITNADVLAFLTASPTPTADFESIIWTLVLDGAPIYVLRGPKGEGPDDRGMKHRILAVLGDPSIERLAVPGVINGEEVLIDGRVVPVIDPDVRGILTWSSKAMALAVGLTGTMTLPPATVDLTIDAGPPTPTDWCSWNTLPTAIRKVTSRTLIGALSPIGDGGPGLLTPYSGSTVGIAWPPQDGTSPPPSPGFSFAGAAASAAAGGLQFIAPADTTPRTLRIYARTFASSGQIRVTLSDGSSPDYVDASFNAFPSVSGLPGVVDGVYTVTYRARESGTVTVRLIGTPATGVTANPLTVTLFERPDGPGGHSQQVPVGLYPESAIAAEVKGVGSAYVPPGLRLTVFNKNSLGPNRPAPGEPILGKALAATTAGALFTTLPEGVSNSVRSLIVEPENYVGIQAVSLRLAPEAGSSLVPFGSPLLLDFMDRVYYLLRNVGLSSSERAVNYAATQLAPVPESQSQVAPNRVLANALAAGLGLESISAEPSLGGRVGSDCWDVKFSFFDPRQIAQAARTYVRLTVDVSSVRPVAVSPARMWTAY